MNTSARIIFCRIAFVLLVALPTCATLAYVATVTLQPLKLSPKAWSLQLSKELGLQIHIGKLERTALGVFVLEEFRVGDPESDEIWITAPRVEAMIDAKELTLSTRNAAINAGSLRKIDEYLQHRILRGREEDFRAISLKATDSKLLLSDEVGAMALMPKFELITRQQKEGPEIEAKATLVEDGAEVWAALWASRIRTKGKTSTKWEWGIEGGEGLSTRILAELSPEWRKLGQHAKFRGSMVNFGDELSKYQLSGVQIQDIDLAILGESWGIEGLTGFASLSGTRQGQRSGEPEHGALVEFRSGKITDLFGEFRIQQGSCDGALLGRIAGALHLETAEGMLKQRFISFDECALVMEMRGENLRLRGLLDNNAVMLRDREPLAWFSSVQKIRNAHDLATSILAEVHSESLPTSQWIAAMPSAKTGGPAATTARKPSKTR